MAKYRFFCFLVLLLISTGCKGEKFLNDSLNNRYAYLKKYDKHLKENNINIVNRDYTDTLFTVQKVKTSFYPYIIAWGGESEFKVNLNSIPIDLVNRYIKDYSGSDSLEAKLNGRKIELKVKSIPNYFNISFNKGIILILVINMSSRGVEMESDISNLIVEYKILGEMPNEVLKKGRITIENIDYSNHSEESSTIVHYPIKEKKYDKGKVASEKYNYYLENNVKKTKYKNFLNNYLNSYESKLRRFSNELVDRLIEEID